MQRVPREIVETTQRLSHGRRTLSTSSTGWARPTVLHHHPAGLPSRRAAAAHRQAGRREASVTVELAKLVLEIVKLGMTAVVLVMIALLIT
jgi:hypothetical protein